MKIFGYSNLNPLFHRGGGERFYVKFLEKFAERGNEVLSIHDMERPLWRGETRNGVRYENRAFRKVEEQIYNSDVVVTQLRRCESVIDFAHKYHKPVVYIVHSDFNTIKWLTLKLKPEDWAIYNTEWVKKEVPSYARQFVIHPMLDVKDVKVNRKYITFVNPILRKGVNMFYDIVDCMPEERFLVVEGGYGAQDVRMKKNVEFVKATDHMFDDVYSKTKLLLAPSDYESYGMVCAEAGYCGIPVVCTDLVGFRECLGECGEYVNGGLAEWLAAIKKVSEKTEYKKRSKEIKEYIRSKTNDNEFDKFYLDLTQKLNVL